MSTLERAIVIAANGHAGVKDKAGAPYILHPLRMMLSLSSLDERIVAVLHDVCEDCEGWTLGREGVASNAAALLIFLRPHPGRHDYPRFSPVAIAQWRKNAQSPWRNQYRERHLERRGAGGGLHLCCRDAGRLSGQQKIGGR